MKILVIVDSINVNDSSGSKANVALIQNLAACGFEVQVLHYTQKEITLEGVTCIFIPEKKWNFLYAFSRAERLFTRITKISLNRHLEDWFGFSFTFFNDSNSIAKAIRKQKDFQPDLVLTLSKGASFRPHHAMLQLPELHDKWMAYVHDPYPFHFYPRPYNWVEHGYYEKQEFFRAVSKKAKYSAFPSQLLQEWMGSYFPDFLRTGVLIPHQISDYQIQDTTFPSFFNPEKFSLFHAGNLMKQRDPIFLIQAFEKFLDNNPEAKEQSQLILVGAHEYHKEALERYKNHSSVFIGENMPFDVIFNVQKQASVNIILESKAEISPFLPGKFPHCVEANKPILLLSPYYSETRRLLGEDYPYWSEADDVSKLEAIITTMYATWKEKNGIFELNRTDLLDYLSVEKLKETLTTLQ
jgi:hypothetical protein